MKLFRFGAPGREKPGVVIEDRFYDATAFGQDYDEAFFEQNGLAKLRLSLQEHPERFTLLRPEERIGPPLCRPSKIVCIGLNYRDHAIETGAPIPGEPIIFFKATTAISGPFDPLVIPRNSMKTDWEVELAVVIGKKASHVSEKDAMQYIAGYCLHNDYSERSFQFERGGQWVKGKSCDSFAPIGPFLVTADEIEDVHNLNLWLKVNGETMQKSSTSQMVFKIPFLVSYLSHFMTLLPGDVISTGTPAGVGLGQKPARYLNPGDLVEFGIEGLGNSSQEVIRSMV